MNMNVADIIKEGWLTISSESFKNLKIYNPIPMPDQTLVPVKIDSDGPFPNASFRMNTKFNPSNVNIIPDKDSFYFRLSANLLYYSELKQDVKVLDSVHISSLTTLSGNVNKLLI
jgi:hypothetical protein